MFNANFPFRIPPTGRDPNLPGDRYGRLTLVEEVAGQGRSRWVVRCDCGEVRQVRLSSLRNGNSISCGCYRREAAAANGRANATHGWHGHPLYNIHYQMMRRCYDQKSERFADWGGRGITVCERWHSVENFVEDMYPTYSPELSLEREDNNLGYSPANCVWATRTEQNRNTRRNRLIAYQGRNVSLAEACELTGLNYKRVHQRIHGYGWSIPRALESTDFQEPLLESPQTPEPPCLNP
jgi:hypothetical protein